MKQKEWRRICMNEVHRLRLRVMLFRGKQIPVFISGEWVEVIGARESNETRYSATDPQRLVQSEQCSKLSPR